MMNEYIPSVQLFTGMEPTTDNGDGRNDGRRRFLKAIGALGVVGIAGCSGDGDGTDTTGTDGDGTDTTETDGDGTDTTGTDGDGTDTTETDGDGTDTATETEAPDQNIPDDPPTVVTLDGGRSVQPGGTATLTATVENPYLFPIQSVQLGMGAPDGDWTVEATGDTNLGTIDTADTATVSWDITAPEGASEGVTLTGTFSYETNSDSDEVSLSQSVAVFEPGDVPEDGLEAYLPFEGDTATNLVTGTDATVVGEPTTGAEGIVGDAFEFTENGTRDSVADAIVTEELPLNGEGATVGAWLNFTGHEDYGRIYQVGGTTGATPTAGWDIEFNEDTDSVWDVHWSSTEDGGGRLESTETSLASGTWLFIVTVVDGDDGRLHVFDESGELEGSPTTGSASREQTDGGALILMAADGSDTVGRMDEVRAYSRALSESEVTALYQGSGGSA
jgi:hypothetical protein